MTTILKSAIRLFAAIVISAALTGCKFHRAYGNFDDGMWLNNQWRYIACRTHETLPVYGVLAAGGMSWTTTKKEWTLVTLPPPGQMTFRPKGREFFSIKGDDGQRFLLVNGSDFLIHQKGGQCTLFDPQPGKDVTKPFPAPYLFNRSRTAGLIVTNGKTVILDTLSALTGEPKVLAQPPWAPVLERLKYGRLSAYLTEDAQHLVLLPSVESPSYVTSLNFIAEVYSTNGTKEHWSIPLERKWEKFVDAESIDGKILILSRLMLDNGAEDEVKLTSMQGEMLHSEKVPASSQTVWNPPANLLLFPPYDFSPINHGPAQTFYLWNYSSNTYQEITR